MSAHTNSTTHGSLPGPANGPPSFGAAIRRKGPIHPGTHAVRVLCLPSSTVTGLLRSAALATALRGRVAAYSKAGVLDNLVGTVQVTGTDDAEVKRLTKATTRHLSGQYVRACHQGHRAVLKFLRTTREHGLRDWTAVRREYEIAAGNNEQAARDARVWMERSQKAGLTCSIVMIGLSFLTGMGEAAGAERILGMSIQNATKYGKYLAAAYSVTNRSIEDIVDANDHHFAAVAWIVSRNALVEGALFVVEQCGDKGIDRKIDSEIFHNKCSLASYKGWVTRFRRAGLSTKQVYSMLGMMKRQFVMVQLELGGAVAKTGWSLFFSGLDLAELGEHYEKHHGG